MKYFSIGFLSIFILLLGIGMLSSCLRLNGLGTAGNPHTLNIEQSKRLGTFLCEYIPSSKSVEIDGEKVFIPIKEAYAERQYLAPNHIQITVVYSGSLDIGDNHSGEIYVNWFSHFTKSHICDYWVFNKVGDTNLPDSIQYYIRERLSDSDSITETRFDTLQTFWLVKKPL